MLRDFLAYASSTDVAPAAASSTGDDSSAESSAAVAGVGVSADPLVAQIAGRLRDEGLVVRENYGTSAHRLDLAVEDPACRGRFIVAVETDGPGYAAMANTRERDRLRIEQLRRLGWEHVRVWTTDVFRDPARDAARVSAAVRAASAQLKEPDAKRATTQDQSRDDTDAGWGERPDRNARDEWLREQRPPHWG